MYSFVIKIATDVNKVVEEVNTIPTLGFIKDIAEVDIADPDSNKTSVIISNTFFLFKFLNYFLRYSLSFLRYFNMFP